MSDGVRLLRRLVLETRGARGRTGRAAIAEDWAPLGTIWADVRPRGGREDFIAGRPRPRVKYRILVRGGAGRARRRGRGRSSGCATGRGSSTS